MMQLTEIQFACLFHKLRLVEFIRSNGTNNEFEDLDQS